ncbi:MAG: carbon-nitrogen hydrolase family protein [Fulvivirga sp.]|nr:carbon-nitrogen hydrolase family protein [Fulvivirga sp.]
MKIKVALVQDHPVFFDKNKTLEKLIAITEKQAKQGSELIIFPESFIPGYPRGFTFGTTVGDRKEEGKKLYATYHEQSFDIKSDDLTILTDLSKSLNIYMVVGITEKSGSNNSLYCSVLYISPEKGLMGVHRKIKPTGAERIIWAEGDGKDLVTFKTPIGSIGGLICWENYMPLARMAIYQQGVDLYIAPTADARDGWTATMRHIALEGRCFVLGCNQYFEKSMYPEQFHIMLKDEPEVICRGGSVIVDPDGNVIAGPLFDQSGVLTASIDLELIKKSKFDFDVTGHYSRNDIFDFKVKR